VALKLDGPAGPLEALLQECDGGPPAFAALVCHPHPLHGGTLDNKVVHRVAATLHDLGATTLRFNFRGVGSSSGHFDHGAGELEDARAALVWLRERLPGAALLVAGFSFGAWVAARLAASEPTVGRLVLIGPPVVGADFAALRTAPVPKLVIQGTADGICPLSALEPEFATWAAPRRLETVEGATHFFDRRLGELAKALREGLRELS
jgi:alpha/beta superfamily hydrolase